jgi:arylsulfatase A-like enzyme
MPERPNFLYIMTDHYTTMAFSYIGNKDLHTPNLDRLACEGHFFANAYCTFPLSTPSLASIITGMMPSENKVNENRLPLPDEFHAESLGRILKDNGYNAAWGGKWHVGDLRLERKKRRTDDRF